MPLERFDPPGFLNDFNDDQRAAWNRYLSGQFDEAREGRPDEYEFDGPREQFYNPTKLETAEDARSVDINWIAFPRNVSVTSVSDRQRWRRADASRDVQDEYCEWSVERHPQTDKLTRVTFTCEGPEYWTFLANTAPGVALRLYREFIGPQVQLDDLFTEGRYNPRNRWNSSTVDGAMHLIQQNNTLEAEIELAAGSSVRRLRGGQELTDSRELIICGQYGGLERHSDPHIGAEVNRLTRMRADVTLANPVGLYFAGLNTAGWRAPDGSDPRAFWRIVRGTAEKPVRAVFEVPEGRGFAVGDITIAERPLEFGAQIADFISIKLTGTACRFGRSAALPFTACRRRRPVPSEAIAGEELSVLDILGVESRGRR